MQQGYNDLDVLIQNSFEEVSISEDYNNKLLFKLNRKESKNNQINILAFSLIMAGMLLIFMYTSDVGFKLVNAQCRIKVELSSLANHFDIFKFILGE